MFVVYRDVMRTSGDGTYLRRLTFGIGALLILACTQSTPQAGGHNNVTPSASSTGTPSAPATSPPLKAGLPLAQPALAVDSSQHVLAFGPEAIDGNAHPGALYSWDGARWTAVATKGAIPGYTSAGLAAEPGSHRLVPFGGFTPGARSDLTWALDGDTWSQLRPAHHPLAQDSPAMALDPIHGQLIVFGGCCGPGSQPNGGAIPLAETWNWTGSDWVRMAPAHSPPARMQANLLWDPDRKELILFGGYGILERSLLDTWAWDGTDWHRLQSLIAGPQATEQGHALAYDGVRHRLLLFISITNTTLSRRFQLWTFGGQGEWKPEPDDGPPMGSSPQMIWNATGGEVVLIETRAPSGLGQTWTWDGLAWTQRSL